jgi:hypothetical protein
MSLRDGFVPIVRADPQDACGKALAVRYLIEGA